MAKSLFSTSSSTGVDSRIPSVEDRPLHGDQQVARAQLQIHRVLRDLLIEAADDHNIRDDVARRRPYQASHARLPQLRASTLVLHGNR
jgi:hypothetical protein